MSMSHSANPDARELWQPLSLESYSASSTPDDPLRLSYPATVRPCSTDARLSRRLEMPGHIISHGVFNEKNIIIILLLALLFYGQYTRQPSGVATTEDTGMGSSPSTQLCRCLCPLEPILALSTQSAAWFDQKAAIAAAFHSQWTKIGPWTSIWHSALLSCQWHPTSLSVLSKAHNVAIPWHNLFVSQHLQLKTERFCYQE